MKLAAGTHGNRKTFLHKMGGRFGLIMLAVGRNAGIPRVRRRRVLGLQKRVLRRHPLAHERRRVEVIVTAPAGAGGGVLDDWRPAFI